MTIPIPFFTQYECRNETLEVYASDRRGEVLYQFNNFGYRNSIDYFVEDSNVAVYLGSSITSGIGVDWTKTYGWLSSQQLGTKCYSFGQGCIAVDNQELLRLLNEIKKTALCPKYFVIQFINLDRRYDAGTGQTVIECDQQSNLYQFEKTFDAIENLLQHDRWCFVGVDATDTPIPDRIRKHNNCVGWNLPMIDRAGVGEHPGVKWHKMVAHGIVKLLQNSFS